MKTFWQDIKAKIDENCGGEAVEICWISSGGDRVGEYKTTTPWEVLNYEYDSSYGGQDCHNFILWTKSYIVTLHEYDGATWPISFPRNWS